MKNIFYSILLVVSTFFLNACTEDAPIFIADLSSEEIAFQNTFANDYLLSEETQDNIADRFIWNETTLGTNNDYEVQGSIDPLFGTFNSIGRTNDTNYPVLVGQLLTLAFELGLDDDPTTTDDDGNPNNTGVVYFRVQASIGNDGAGSESILSEIQNINITLIEKVVETDDCDGIWVVGEAVVNIGWTFSAQTNCEVDVQSIKLEFQAGIFNFFEVEGDWDSGLGGYTYFVNQGYTIDPNLEDAGDGDHNFNFVGTPGIYTLTIDGVNKTISLVASSSLWAVGGAVNGGWGFNDDTVELVENTPDIWTGSITFSNDIFRFFSIWDSWDLDNNFAYYVEEGFTIDSNFENDGEGDANFNFVGTPGTYEVIINAVDKTITLN
ncbi:MAG: SusE domain-containing protein [Oleispira sp.]|nr:SusE domain-containing protein [Oleispira sp.]